MLGSKICRPARRDLRHDGSTFLDADWLWWLGDPSSSPAGVGETNDGPSSAGIDSTSEGKADTKSWFSTPALPGQLSTAGGWGLYFLDKLGVLACGDFWPWVGWGAVITLAVFLSVLILMIVTSICRPIRSFCTCCCRQTKRWHAEWGSSSLSCKWGVLTSPWISGWHVANCFTGFRPENTFCWRKCHHGPAERGTTGSTMPHQEHPTWKL